jgi:phosphate transport system permease protein
MIRDAVVADPSVIGESLTLNVPASDPYDQLYKGLMNRELPENRRRLGDEQIAWFDTLVEEGRVSRPFNWGLFVNADSRFPEIAGLKGAIVGSFYALLVCFLISFPVGISAAVYLEEFAPKNRATDVIEVNINNLAAVPSIVFGLLGLAVFIQIFGLPRSAPLVGGMVLSLMTLPTIIIVTRNALKAVPPSIREAGFGVGASHHQVIMHHVLPLALPGILTGTIIGLAQALGETAPLLLIGMNAFITSPPSGVMDASTALPTQIFIWADSPERGFVSRTSAAILVLLGFLILMNGIAIFLRQRLERTW